MNGQLAVRRDIRIWTAATLAVVAPLVVLLCRTLWRMPFPLSEAVAIFEDVQRNPPLAFFKPEGSYYRPLFFVTLSSIWHGASTVRGALDGIRLLHILPIAALVVLFAAHLRPRRFIEAAVAVFAFAVLLGSPGFLDNLELPLSYTIIGMPIALGIWMLAERPHRWWHGPLIVALTIVAVGFKEQGLVIVPVVLVAWWTGAPGIRRGTVIVLVLVAVTYVLLRLNGRGGWPPFEENIGLGFTTFSTDEAQARFGKFPLWIYAYNSASTVANLLCAEPTAGVFRSTNDILRGSFESWEVIRPASSIALTLLIAWWGIAAVMRSRNEGWSIEARAALALIVAALACGALSFDYSRDRLGGMAVPFYAVAAYYATRAAVSRLSMRGTGVWLAGALALLLLGAAWQTRALYTLEYTRQRAINNRREWLTALEWRRMEFANRPIYMRTMNEMARQGSAPMDIVRTQYPRWFYRALGE